MRREDLRLVARAMRERWPIPDEVRLTLLRKLREVIVRRKTTPRELAAVGKVLLGADRLNLDQEKLDIVAELKAKIAELEARVAGRTVESGAESGTPDPGGEPPPPPDGPVPP